MSVCIVCKSPDTDVVYFNSLCCQDKSHRALQQPRQVKPSNLGAVLRFISSILRSKWTPLFFYPFSLIWLSFFFLFPKLNIELNNIRRGKDTIEQKACWEWFLDLNREDTEKFNIYAIFLIFFLQSFLLLLTNSLRLNEYVKWVLSPWRKKEEKQLRKKLHLKQTKISDSVFSGVSLSALICHGCLVGPALHAATA